jgi:hypothetical protein
VLPLERLGLPLSALVVGAVAPDAPVYLPVGVSYQTTHSGWGVAVDVVIGLAVLWLWFALLRDAVVDLTPSLRTRAPAQVRLCRRAWLLSPLAVAVGAGTHVLWDSATHDWGFVAQEVAFFRQEYGPIKLYGWLQHVSTVAGSVVVAAYCVLRLSRRPVLPRSPAVRRTGLWLAPVPLAALAVGIVFGDPEAAVGACTASTRTRSRAGPDDTSRSPYSRFIENAHGWVRNQRRTSARSSGTRRNSGCFPSGRPSP